MKTINRTEIPAAGAPLGGGFFTAILVVNGLHFAMVTAGKEAELKAEWGKYGEKIEAASSFIDGLANTEAMATAGIEIAIKVRAMRFGDMDDWAIPARNQQELQYRYHKPTTHENYCSYLDGYNPDSVPAGELYTDTNPLQTTAESFREGGAEAFEAEWYWSSTQSSASLAFCQTFNGGYQYYLLKVNELRVRPVRMIQIID
jgi:hypothetical protein